MTVRHFSVRKISTRSLAKFGCVLGGLVMTLPGILGAVGIVAIVAMLRTLLDTWQAASADLLGLGAPVEFDFIRLLGLAGFQAIIIRLDDQRFMLALLVFLSITIGGGLLAAIIVLLAGWVYNLLAALSGGLEVEMWE